MSLSNAISECTEEAGSIGDSIDVIQKIGLVICERVQSGDIFLNLCRKNGIVSQNQAEVKWYSKEMMDTKDIVDFIIEMSQIFGLENQNLIPLLILFDRISKIPFDQVSEIVDKQFDDEFNSVRNKEHQLKINSYTVYR